MGDELPGAIDTVVVGAGQAGLIMSYHLGRAGREHVVLDRRETLGGGWQDRWDAFQLVSPELDDRAARDSRMTARNRTSYLHRDEVIARIAGYADGDRGAGPARDRGRAADARTASDAARFRLETSRGTIRARDVIVATGAFHTPKIPPTAAALRAADPPAPRPRLSKPRSAPARRRPAGRIRPDGCASWPRNCRRPGAT